jgi:hypothetical protein
MVVPGAVADHTYAGETHDFPMVDGHPRPACGFGLMYAFAGVQYDAIKMQLGFSPVVFPLKIALTHLADWENERVAWVKFRRSIPNQIARRNRHLSSIPLRMRSAGRLGNSIEADLKALARHDAMRNLFTHAAGLDDIALAEFKTQMAKVGVKEARIQRDADKCWRAQSPEHEMRGKFVARRYRRLNQTASQPPTMERPTERLVSTSRTGFTHNQPCGDGNRKAW